MRRIATVQALDNPAVCVLVYRDSETLEYVARIPGRPQADYFTECRADVLSTAQAMANHRAQALQAQA